MKTNITSTPKSKTLLSAILALIISALTIVAVSGCASANANNEPTTGTVSLAVDSPDWTENDAPVVVHLTSDTEDFYHVVSFDANPSEFEAFPGEYTSEVLSTLTADGYLLTCEVPATFTVEAGMVTNGTLTLTKPETKATVEELDAYLTAVTTARDAGDDTVTDEVVTRATELVNAAKAAIAAEEQAKAEAEAKAAAEAEAAAATTSSNSGSYSAPKSSSGNGGGYSTPSGNSGDGGSSHVSDSDWDRYIKNSTDTVNEAHRNGESVSTANPGGNRSADD